MRVVEDATTTSSTTPHSSREFYVQSAEVIDVNNLVQIDTYGEVKQSVEDQDAESGKPQQEESSEKKNSQTAARDSTEVLDVCRFGEKEGAPFASQIATFATMRQGNQ